MDRYFSRKSTLNVTEIFDHTIKKEKITIKYLDALVTAQTYREIKTKSITDDFYSNLIDWYNDKIFFAVEDSIFVHDFYTLETSFVYKIPETNITSIKGTHNKIIIGSSMGDLYFFDIPKQKLTKRNYHTSRIGVIKQETSNLLTGSRDKTINIIDIRSSKTSHTLKSHTQEVCGIDISKNFLNLATGGNDNKLFIFDYRNLNYPLVKCSQHKAAVKALSWSPLNSNLLVSGGGTADKTVKLWDIDNITGSSSDCLINSMDYGSQVCNLKWLLNNQIVSTHGYSKNDIRISDPLNFKCQKQFLGHRNRVIHFSVSQDERFFVTGSSDCSIKFWELRNEMFNELKIR